MSWNGTECREGMGLISKLQWYSLFKKEPCNNSLRMSGFRLDRNVSIRDLASSITREDALDERNTDHECEGTTSAKDFSSS